MNKLYTQPKISVKAATPILLKLLTNSLYRFKLLKCHYEKKRNFRSSLSLTLQGYNP